MKIIKKYFKNEIKIIFILIKSYFIMITLFFNDKTISRIKFILFYKRVMIILIILNLIITFVMKILILLKNSKNQTILKLQSYLQFIIDKNIVKDF